MKVLTNSADAKRLCMEQRSFSIAHLHKETDPLPMHMERCYEVYFSISGGQTFCINDRNFRMEPGNLFLFNQYESHRVSQFDPSAPYERIVIFIHPGYLEELSTDQTDLSRCFTHRPEKFSNRLVLDTGQQRRFAYYTNKFTRIQGFGSDIAERAVFMEFMLFLNKAVLDEEENRKEPEESPVYFHSRIAEIEAYIDKNIDSPLSIGDIAARFYLSGPYLCRLFKKTTGMTINGYITMRRIDLAQNLLSGGYSVNEACGMCGFNDYSNFFKAFTKQVGISPKRYSQNSLS